MRKIALLCVAFICSSLSLLAQTQVKGKVLDATSGAPVAGATVKVKGQKNIAVTNADGTFEVTALAGSVIEVSEVGHQTQTLKYSGTGNIEVSLAVDTKSLSEVVVTGVGVATSKRKVAIDVSSLNIKDAGKSAVASVEQALQGKIAGANVQFTSGVPGSAAQIVLRGVNTLGAKGPLIMVDGVEIQGGVTGLDLSSVEKVEVVKGAAGGTLYGAQGANGVIQIFTKKGQRGKRPAITIQSQLSTDQILRGKELLANHHHFVTDANGYITNSSGTRLLPDANNSWEDPSFADAGLSGYDAANIKNDKSYKETLYDHLSQAYRKAMTSNTNLNISGGGENSDYAFSLGYLNQENVLYNGYKRLNLGSNLGLTLAKGLTLRSNTQLIYTNEDLLAGGSRFNLTNSWRFVDFTAKDTLGNTVVKPKSAENQLNPLSEREWRTRTAKTYRILQNANLNYKFPRFLELDYKYGIEITNDDDFNYYKNQNNVAQPELYWGTNQTGIITNTYTRNIYQNSLASAFLRFDFAKDFGLKIPLNSTTQVSYDWRKAEKKQYFSTGSDLPPFPPANINLAANKTSGDYSDAFVTYGVLVNQTFDYGNLFGISGGVRSDYSSEFGEGKNAQTFYRGSAYFRPSELLKSNILTDWKIRAAYGKAGNQPTRFLRQATLDVTTTGIGGTGISLPSVSSNPKLILETSAETEIGTDLTFKTSSKSWFSRINLSASYWKRKSNDLYQEADQPLSTGSAKKWDNLSTLSLRGFDVSIDADVYQSQNFIWNFGIRFAQFTGKVEKIANSAAVVAGIFTLQEGQSLGTLAAQAPLTSLDQLKADKTPYIAEADRGKYELVNGMVVDTATKRVVVTSADDTKIIGSAYPKFNASFIHNFTIFNNFNIGIQLDWRYGNKIYNLTRQWLYRDRLSADYDKAVTIGGQSGAYVQYYNSLYNNVSPISWFAESGSMLRLRDVSLSYSLDNKWRPKFLRAASLTVAARNLFTVTKYSGLDPEATNTSDAQGNAAPAIGVNNGVDYFGVPNLKSFIITLNLGF